MAILRIFMVLVMIFLNGCIVSDDGTITIITPVESDTFISSSSEQDHSNLDYLSVSRNGTDENRILVKLPTGENNRDSHLDGCLSNPFCFFFYMPLFIVAAIVAPNCADESFTAANLNWANLQFETEDNSSPAAGSLNIELVGQGWWHSVTWNRTHPFSSAGLWETPGGVIDNSQTFDPNCTNLQGGQTCGAGEVKFDMTNYMTFLLDNPNSTHFGLMISWAADNPELRLISSQGGFSGRPQLVANYNCLNPAEAQTSVYRFGDPLPVR